MLKCVGKFVVLGKIFKLSIKPVKYLAKFMLVIRCKSKIKYFHSLWEADKYMYL